MKLDEKVLIVFKNKEGQKEQIQITVYEMLENTTDDFLEMLDEPCNSSGCNNESQNFCDCGSSFEDYEISEVIFLENKK